jgi:hypothetical protein
MKKTVLHIRNEPAVITKVWVTADHRRGVGRVEGHQDRRAAEVVHDDHHHRQRVRGQDTRPDAGTADALYQFDSWLSGGAGPELLRPWDQRSLQMYPVSRRVNSSKAAGDDPTLIERIAV